MDMLKECAVISQKKVCIQKQRIKQSWHVVEKRTHNKRKTWRVTKKKNMMKKREATKNKPCKVEYYASIHNYVDMIDWTLTHYIMRWDVIKVILIEIKCII